MAMPLPHVVPFDRTPIYYFTACTAQRRAILDNATAHDCLRDLWHQATTCNGWFVGSEVIIPDHVHFYASPAAAAMPRATWHRLWKSISARSLTLQCGLVAPIRQEDVFDHILRSRESYAAKWEYVRDNPARQGLMARQEDWPWQGEIHRLEVR